MYDGTTSKRRKDIATYYNVLKEWNELSHDCDFVTDYYNLLLLVKRDSPNDSVLISFIEGLHRHSAIIACLLCAKFDYLNNILVPDSLRINTFTDADIQYFALPVDSSFTPKHALCEIVNNPESTSSMLNTPINVITYIPKNTNLNLITLMECTKNMSAKISMNKRDSAITSISLGIASGLTYIMAHAISNQINNVEKNTPQFNDTMKYQEHMSSSKFMDIINGGNDHLVGYPKLLRGKEYTNYTRDPLNVGKRDDLISQVSPSSTKSKKNKKIKPSPYSWLTF